MKALIQRVSTADVSVDDKVIAKIGKGFLVLLGIKQDDTRDAAEVLAGKTASLRIFPDEHGKMNLSIKEVNGEVLVVSQFTLHADTRKGNRPSFILAADPVLAKELYEHYIKKISEILGESVIKHGIFQAYMQVSLINDGPVTIELKSRDEYENK
jgi:D-tyrosyl-tRNA(Tyr) deacylase